MTSHAKELIPVASLHRKESCNYMKGLEYGRKLQSSNSKKKLTGVLASVGKNSRPRKTSYFWIEQVHSWPSIAGDGDLLYKVVACRIQCN